MQSSDEQIFTFVNHIKSCMKDEECRILYLHETINPQDFIATLKQHNVDMNKEILFKEHQHLIPIASSMNEYFRNFKLLVKRTTKHSLEKNPDKLSFHIFMDTVWLGKTCNENRAFLAEFMKEAKETINTYKCDLHFFVNMKKAPGTFVVDLMEYCNYHLIGGKLFEYNNT